jgi:hypothetical protein
VEKCGEIYKVNFSTGYSVGKWQGNVEKYEAITEPISLGMECWEMTEKQGEP